METEKQEFIRKLKREIADIRNEYCADCSIKLNKFIEKNSK